MIVIVIKSLFSVLCLASAIGIGITMHWDWSDMHGFYILIPLVVLTALSFRHSWANVCVIVASILGAVFAGMLCIVGSMFMVESMMGPIGILAPFIACLICVATGVVCIKGYKQRENVD